MALAQNADKKTQNRFSYSFGFMANQAHNYKSSPQIVAIDYMIV